MRYIWHILTILPPRCDTAFHFTSGVTLKPRDSYINVNNEKSLTHKSLTEHDGSKIITNKTSGLHQSSMYHCTTSWVWQKFGLWPPPIWQLEFLRQTVAFFDAVSRNFFEHTNRHWRDAKKVCDDLIPPT